MIDQQESRLRGRRVNVRVCRDGRGRAYIPIGHEQLADVRRVLDAAGVSFTVDENAGSDATSPAARVDVVNLGGADPDQVQTVLDADLAGAGPDEVA